MSDSNSTQTPGIDDNLSTYFAITAGSFVALFVILVLLFAWQISWNAPPKKKKVSQPRRDNVKSEHEHLECMESIPPHNY
jgi:hypothetical protein